MYGEVPVAYVVTYPETAVTADDILILTADHLSSRLTEVELPVAIHIVNTLAPPRTPSARSTNRDCGSHHRPAAVS